MESDSGISSPVNVSIHWKDSAGPGVAGPTTSRPSGSADTTRPRASRRATRPSPTSTTLSGVPGPSTARSAPSETEIDRVSRSPCVRSSILWP